MATIFDFKGDTAKADFFQDKWDLWIDEIKKFAPILGMNPNDIKKFYQKNKLFKQFIDTTQEQIKYYEKVRDAVQE